MSGLRSQRLALLVLALSLALLWQGCSRPPDPQRAFDQAQGTFVRGDLALARREADAAYRRFSGNELQWAWKFRLLEAEILLDQGLSADVLSLLDSNLPQQFSRGDLAIKQLTLQGGAYAQLDRFQDADRRLKEAEDLSGKLNSPLAGEVARARGVLAFRQNDQESSGLFLRQSLRLARQQNDVHLQMTDLTNLGAVAERQEHYDEAIDWLNDAYRAASVLHDRHTAQVALGNLGWAYYKMGDFDRSLAFYQEAEKAAKDLGAAYDQIGWLNNIGLVYYQQNQLTIAEDYYRQSLALAQENQNSELIVDALTSLAFVSAQTGQLAEAQRYSEEAFEKAHARNDRSSELYPLLVRGQVAAGRGDYKQAEEVFHEVVNDPKSDLSLRWQAQNDLARLYEHEHRLTAADKQYRRALATIEQARATLQREEFKLPFLANAAHLYDDYISFLVAQGKDRRALELADYSRARTLAEGLGALPKNAPVDAPAMNAQREARAAHATILFYWLGREHSYLWAITPNQTARYQLPPASEIDAAVLRYRQALLGWQDVLKTANVDGTHLYDVLMAPARKLIPSNSRVILITDGSLDSLNFETLLVSTPAVHYWIEDATVLTASSLRVLAASKNHRDAETGKLLLIGDAIAPSSDYAPLPNAMREVQNIESHFTVEKRETFTRDHATPAAYLTSDPGQFSFIHFVAHATASKLSPLDSAIVLSRSSGDQDSFKLYARDITPHLLHANLVTISSCYGAGAEAYSGEGLVGLSWAFLRAGAHNVIGALWDVSDASTADLMGRMYDELKRGQTPEAALRTAKLSLLHSDGVARKPFYWAPFQLYTGRR
ncbi:MAG: CHAT domain-containing tetratricopeptide repeat protein [Candidatus Sulfotelmatobacter sp.]